MTFKICNKLFRNSIIFLLSTIAISCGSDSSQNDTSGEALARAVFDTEAETVDTSDTSIIGLWEKQNSSDSLRLLVKETSTNTFTYIYAKKCIRDNLELYSSVEFDVTNQNNQLTIGSDVSDAALVNGKTCSTQSNLFQNATYTTTFNPTDFNRLNFDSPNSEELKNFLKISSTSFAATNTVKEETVEEVDLSGFDWLALEGSTYMVGYKWLGTKLYTELSINDIQLVVKDKNSNQLLNFSLKTLQPRMKCCNTRPQQDQEQLVQDKVITVSKVVFNRKGRAGSWELLTQIKIGEEVYKPKIQVNHELL